MQDNATENRSSLPLLPLKNSVVFPHLLAPLSAGRPQSMAAIETALNTESKEILIVAQKDASVENPQSSDLYEVGVRAIIRKVARREKSMEVLVQGVERVRLDAVGAGADGYLQAYFYPAPIREDDSAETEALFRSVLETSAQVFALARHQDSFDLNALLGKTSDRPRITYLLTSMAGMEVEKEQKILEANSLGVALQQLSDILSYELQVLELREKISSQAQSEINQEQRQYILRRQLRQIQQELGEEDGEGAEIEMLRERLEEAELPEEAHKEAERELKRLSRLQAASPEYHTIRTYLDLILDLPWNKTTQSEIDLQHSKDVLDEDHYDLEEVKERILDQLAVHKLNPGAKAPIICFAGPPGVGKTSLGKSIARSLNRPFERISLGGLHDESELRGHRRTYIGSMPGRIIQALRRAGSKDPVLMLDEIDKLGRDFRGDPAAALLEILDPAQNHTFRDNYVDLPFDLSKVFFIVTANTLGTIPRPLLDRLEVIRLEGYTADEKVQIAKRYLVPRQIDEVGLDEQQCVIGDDTLERIVDRYTREAGVRQLERAVGKIARKVARQFAEGRQEAVQVQIGDLDDMLGVELFFPEEARRKLSPGVATGLAWTESGGDVLFIEASLLPEGRGLTLTGQLGEVMQESAKAAQSYIWSRAQQFGIDPKQFKNSGVHIHIPAGAIPKDGPSAGVTMVTALASLYSKTAARADTAMTGEITLSGLVLPVGGVKEKVLAAQRAGVGRVILPAQNRKDLKKLPDNVAGQMEFIFVENVDQLLSATIPEIPNWKPTLSDSDSAHVV
ncbi:MAG TPA: endopeptidase La [Acidobacteriota bacterium]|nr:endopeptidase La [Acidobacteriota bacterium]